MTSRVETAVGGRYPLREVDHLAYIKGIPFDAKIRFRQLLITGPPGCGKSTLVRALGGWPEEGYLDLTERRWWRSRVLTFRPREVHLGLPFRGRREALALFEKEWIEAEEPLELDPLRIEFPPEPRLWNPIDWRQRFVFEFLLPPAEKVFAGRQERSYKQTHHVDVELSLDQVSRQLETYWTIAKLFHRAGLNVFVRDDHGVPPKTFVDDPGPAGLRAPRKARTPVEASAPQTGTPPVAAPDRSPRVVRAPLIWNGAEAVRIVATKLDVRLEDLPIAIQLGPQAIEAHREVPLDGGAERWPGDVLLLDPEQYYSRVSGFVRLGAGTRTRIGKGAEDRMISARLPREFVPSLEFSNAGTHLRIVDLHSAGGTVVCPVDGQHRSSRLPGDREQRLTWVGRIFGHRLLPLEAAEATQTLGAVIAQLEEAQYRPLDSRGLPGALVELPAEMTPIIVGDFHGNLDNLLRVLSENRFLDGLESGDAALIFLGDAVHSEEDGELGEMESSMTMMDLVFKLMLEFPGRVYYLQGNHDSFSAEVTKDGVDQGQIWRRTLEQTRGGGYVQRMQRFYDLSPVVVTSADFVACHAGPSQGAIDRRYLVELHDHPNLRHQLTWNRRKRPGHPAGYGKRDVRVFRRSLGLGRSSALVVSHNPQDDGEAVWWDFGGIKNHHLVYAARKDKLAVITRVGGDLVPLTFWAERLLPRLEAGAESS